MAADYSWEAAYGALIKAILDIEDSGEPVDQVLVDRAEELTAMANELKHSIRMAIAECDRHRMGITKWN